MQREIDALINFIELYADDYLEDGTKENVIESLKNGNTNLALELVKCMNREWVERTKEVEKFYLFTDSVKCDSHSEALKKPYYRSSYIDSLDPNNTHIPALRKVKPYEIADLSISINKDNSDYTL